MPEEDSWSLYFNPAVIFGEIGLTKDTGVVVDIGSGYATFTIPAAMITHSTVYAFDSDDEMISVLLRKIHSHSIINIVPMKRNVLSNGTGLPDGCAEFVFLFNVLHTQYPRILLDEAFRILSQEGKVVVLHWRTNIPTPYGPPSAIRPSPKDCRAWIKNAGSSPE